MRHIIVQFMSIYSFCMVYYRKRYKVLSGRRRLDKIRLQRMPGTEQHKEWRWRQQSGNHHGSLLFRLLCVPRRPSHCYPHFSCFQVSNLQSVVQISTNYKKYIIQIAFLLCIPPLQIMLTKMAFVRWTKIHKIWSKLFWKMLRNYLIIFIPFSR